MVHESDGAVPHWKSRVLLCWDCALEYVQQWEASTECPVCGPHQSGYDVRDIKYDRKREQDERRQK